MTAKQYKIYAVTMEIIVLGIMSLFSTFFFLMILYFGYNIKPANLGLCFAMGFLCAGAGAVLGLLNFKAKKCLQSQFEKSCVLLAELAAAKEKAARSELQMDALMSGRTQSPFYPHITQIDKNNRKN